MTSSWGGIKLHRERVKPCTRFIFHDALRRSHIKIKYKVCRREDGKFLNYDCLLCLFERAGMCFVLLWNDERRHTANIKRHRDAHNNKKKEKQENWSKLRFMDDDGREFISALNDTENLFREIEFFFSTAMKRQSRTTRRSRKVFLRMSNLPNWNWKRRHLKIHRN